MEINSAKKNSVYTRVGVCERESTYTVGGNGENSLLELASVRTLIPRCMRAWAIEVLMSEPNHQ